MAATCAGFVDAGYLRAQGAAATCAPITRTTRGIRSEVEIGLAEGLPEPCAINCDNILTVPLTDLDPQPVGRLSEAVRADLDRALRYALDIAYWPISGGELPRSLPGSCGPRRSAHV